MPIQNLEARGVDIQGRRGVVGGGGIQQIGKGRKEVRRGRGGKRHKKKGGKKRISVRALGRAQACLKIPAPKRGGGGNHSLKEGTGVDPREEAMAAERAALRARGSLKLSGRDT